jgi:hypothetical protein
MPYPIVETVDEAVEVLTDNFSLAEMISIDRELILKCSEGALSNAKEITISSRTVEYLALCNVVTALVLSERRRGTHEK